jgi:hypothetical protein
MAANQLCKMIVAAVVVGIFLLAVAPALIVPLTLGAAALYQDPKRMNERTRRVVQWAVGIIVATIICWAALYFIERVIFAPEEGRKEWSQSQEEWHFWFQIVTGNWSSPPKEYAVHPLRNSISMVLAFGLNLVSLGIFSAILWLVARFRKEYVMTTVRSLIALRDLAVRTAFEISLRKSSLTSEQKNEVRDILRQAFIEGSDEFTKKDLPEWYGVEKAEEQKGKLETLSI